MMKKLNKLLDDYLRGVKYTYDNNFNWSVKYLSESFTVDHAFEIGSIKNIKSKLNSVDFDSLIEKNLDDKLKSFLLDSLIGFKTSVDEMIGDEMVILGDKN